MLSLIEAIEASCWLLISEECFGAMNSEINQLQQQTGFN